MFIYIHLYKIQRVSRSVEHTIKTSINYNFYNLYTFNVSAPKVYCTHNQNLEAVLECKSYKL